MVLAIGICPIRAEVFPKSYNPHEYKFAAPASCAESGTQQYNNQMDKAKLRGIDRIHIVRTEVGTEEGKDLGINK